MKEGDLETLQDSLCACFFDLKTFLDIIEEMDADADLGGQIALLGKNLLASCEGKMIHLLGGVESFLGKLYVHGGGVFLDQEVSAVGLKPSNLFALLASEGKLAKESFLIIETTKEEGSNDDQGGECVTREKRQRCFN